MRKHFFITISDARQVRQFSVHSTVGKILLYVLSGHTLLLMAGIVAAVWLAWKIDALNYARETLSREFHAVMSETHEQRQQATEELADIEKRIQRKREELGIINRVAQPAPPPSSAQPRNVGGPVEPDLQSALPAGKPVADGQQSRISSLFGMRFHPIWLKRLFHKGIDLDIAEQTPILATADGVVEKVKRDPEGFGLMVSLRHAFKLKTIYAHLGEAHVAEGQIVRKGEVIANSGNSGLSTGPHLHYEVRYDDKPINPRPFLKANSGDAGEPGKPTRREAWASLTSYRLQ